MYFYYGHVCWRVMMKISLIILGWLSAQFRNISRFLECLGNTKVNEENKGKLRPLSRRADSDIEEYREYLNQAMKPAKNEIIRNIAIAGKYGSGKSSVIDSYFEQNYRNDYLRVSFATFEGQKQTKKNSEFNENQIYLNIINQIIYQVKSTRIPLTGFKIKRPVTKKKKIVLIATVLLVLMCKFNIPDIHNDLYTLSRDILTVGLLIWIAWSALSVITISNFAMKFRDVSADISIENDDLFEKYGDEIIYLFRQSKKRILIIEDLDRFEDIRIFEKLRELNTKLNANGKVNWQFIYLIKDDIFLDANDRVKFFDLMIPIVPFMTAANSYDKMREIFQGEIIDDELLFDLSLFVTDYRLLTNVFNEYTVFKSSTNTPEFNELLAMVAYKNLFPMEFDSAQNGQGKLSNIFSGYAEISKKQRDDIVRKKQDIINMRESTIARTEAEAFFLFVKSHNISTVQSMNSVQDAKMTVLNNKSVYNNGRPVTYSEFIEQNGEYRKIYDAIVRFEDEIDRLNAEIKKVESLDIESFVPEDLSSQHDKFVYTLIHQGYIRQNYLDVINRFYGEEDSREFLQNVLVAHGENNMKLQFDSIDAWWKKLKTDVFKTKQIQNVSVLNFARENDVEKYQIMLKSAEQYDTMFLEQTLKSNLEKNMSNQDQYLADFIKYAPGYRFQVEGLPNTLIKKIVDNYAYAKDTNNISLLIQYFENLQDIEHLEAKLLVNDSKQSIELREGVLRKAIGKIDLSDLKDIDLWDKALEFDTIHKTIANIDMYFEQKGLTAVLSQFITNNFNDFGESKIGEELFKEMLVDESIDADVVGVFISTVEIAKKLSWAELKPTTSIEKLLLLMEYDLIELTKDVFEEVREAEKNLPSNLINQRIVDFLTEHNIQPLSKWIEKILDHESLDYKKFVKQFMALLTENQYRKILRCVSSQSNKFEKILNKTRGYLNQKIDLNDDNESLLVWLKNQGYIESFTDNGHGSYTIK